MARTTVDPLTGIAPSADVSFSANTDAATFDIFIGNQGEGAMRVIPTWDASEFNSVFIPPHAHRDTVNLAPGDVVVLDSLEIVQLVGIRGAGGNATTFGVTGQKNHVTAASSGNDFLVVGVGSRT